MLQTSIGKLRLVGMLEGLSFLVLCFVAMPMKYIGGDPGAVRIPGMVHGFLWVVLCAQLYQVKTELGWGWKKTLVPFIASLLPFGPFVIDGRLKAELGAPDGPDDSPR